MKLTCECGNEVVIRELPTYGRLELEQEICHNCGRAYSARPGEVGRLLPVCEGFLDVGGDNVVQLQPATVVQLPCPECRMRGQHKMDCSRRRGR